MFLRSFPSLVLKSLSWRMLMHGTVIDGNGNLAYMHLQHTLPFPAQCGKPFLGTTILTVWPLGSRDRSRQLQKIETNHSFFQVSELEQLAALCLSSRSHRRMSLTGCPRYPCARRSCRPRGTKIADYPYCIHAFSPSAVSRP